MTRSLSPEEFELMNQNVFALQKMAENAVDRIKENLKASTINYESLVDTPEIKTFDANFLELRSRYHLFSKSRATRGSTAKKLYQDYLTQFDIVSDLAQKTFGIKIRSQAFMT